VVACSPAAWLLVTGEFKPSTPTRSDLCRAGERPRALPAFGDAWSAGLGDASCR